jgi:TusA-related sulfurtransferase
MSNEGWVGYDLDGVLAEYDGFKGSTKIGKPIPAMVNRLLADVKKGKKVKIFTARADDPKAVAAIQRWLAKNGMPHLPVTNKKDYHTELLFDDRARQVVKNTGEVVGEDQE